MKILNYKEFPKAEPFKFEANEDTLELAASITNQLIVTMNDANLISLSAIQIGLPYTVFAIKSAPNYVLFNPKIVNRGLEYLDLEEACPSYPGLVVKVRRPSEVRVRFQTPSGLVDTRVFKGLTAKHVQHHIEKLEGKNFLDSANWFQRSKAIDKWKKFQSKKQPQSE